MEKRQHNQWKNKRTTVKDSKDFKFFLDSNLGTKTFLSIPIYSTVRVD